MRKPKANPDKDVARELIGEIPVRIKRKADLPLPAMRNLARLWLFVFPGQNHKEKRLVLLLITIWIIITDRFFESRSVSQSQLRIFCQNIDRFLKNKKNYPSNGKSSNKSMDFSNRLLGEIFKILLNQKSDQRLFHQWKRSVINFLKGMMNERDFSYAHPPLLRKYLENGRQSIGSSVVLYAMAIFIFRQPRWLEAREFDIINKIIKDSSLLLRLINDLGSHKRESEYKILNSLVILMKHGEAAESAHEKISRLIKKNLAIHKQSGKSTPLKCRPFYTALDRLLRFTLNLYETKDYHGESPRS